MARAAGGAFAGRGNAVSHGVFKHVAILDVGDLLVPFVRQFPRTVPRKSRRATNGFDEMSVSDV